MAQTDGIYFPYETCKRCGATGSQVDGDFCIVAEDCRPTVQQFGAFASYWTTPLLANIGEPKDINPRQFAGRVDIISRLTALVLTFQSDRISEDQLRTYALEILALAANPRKPRSKDSDITKWNAAVTTAIESLAIYPAESGVLRAVTSLGWYR